jgi:hypothetical protein
MDRIKKLLERETGWTPREIQNVGPDQREDFNPDAIDTIEPALGGCNVTFRSGTKLAFKLKPMEFQRQIRLQTPPLANRGARVRSLIQPL